MKYKNKQHFEEEGNLYNNSSNLKIFHFILINIYLYKIKLANANHKKSNNWAGICWLPVLIFPNFSTFHFLFGLRAGNKSNHPLLGNLIISNIQQ